MVSKTSQKIVKIIERWAVQTRKQWMDAIDREDPLSQLVIMPDTHREVVLEAVPKDELPYYDFSTRVVGFDNVPCNGLVTLLFDGLAYDLLSYESDFHLYRNKLEEMLEKKGFYVENSSACAISIQAS